MKIALIYLGRKGGGPVYSLEIAKRLQGKAEVFCFVSQEIENLSLWQKEIRNLATVHTYSSTLGFLLSWFNWRKLGRLKRKIQEVSPDVLYYPFFHFWLVLINNWFPKIPKVYTCHDPVLHSGEDNWLTRTLQEKVIKQSQRIIILSSVFKEVLVKKGIKPENIDVIPHGIFDYYLEQAKNKQIAPHPPTLLFFGRILDYKGLDTLLRAWLLLKKQMPQALLLIAGSGDLKPYQDLLTVQEGIAIENRWLADSEVADYFLRADVLVCPYKQASQSGAIPVAYVFKMPVVASRVGGLVEQVDDNKTGLLVEPGNVEELASACLKLLQDKALKQQMGEQGYQKAITEWSWERVSQMVLESLRKVTQH